MTNTRIEVDGVVLADWTDTITHSDVDEQVAVEIVEKIEAEEPDRYDRGNVQTILSFSVGREHPNLQAAVDYRLLIRSTVPRVGVLLTLTTKDFNGSVSERYLRTPAIRIRRPQNVGVFTFADFVITGGMFLDKKPT